MITMGKPNKRKSHSWQQSRDEKYHRIKGNKYEGQGFANLRKTQTVSRYHRDLAKEKLKLKDWTEKLKKLYADADDCAEEDDLLKIQSKSKKNSLVLVKRNQSQERKDAAANQDQQSTSEGTANHKVTSSINQVTASKRSKKDVKVSTYFKQEREWKKKMEEKQKRIEEVELKKQEREAAIAKHRQEKIRRHKMLAKRNYKGQPNMASRMELLLEQITKKCGQT